MGVFDQGYEQAMADAARLPAARVPSGFLDAFNATYEFTRQEGLSISERQNYLDKVRQRNEAIEKITGDKLSIDPSDPTLTGYTTVERARQAHNRRINELAARHSEVKTDDDLFKEIIEDSRRIREKHDSVLSNTTFTGKVGSFTGAMAATLTDPLVMASIPFGASSSAGILRTALTEAGINIASEALIQPFVYRYKQSIGSPYSVGEALTNVAAAGAGGAVIGGGIRAITRGIQRFHGVDDLIETFERSIPEPTQAQRDAAHVLGDFADVMRETPFEIRPDLDDVHLRATAKALSDLDANQAVDVQDFVRGIDPRDEIRTFPKTISGTAPAQAATENQSLGQFVKNSGGVSIEQAGALRGEYEALFESGGRTSGAVKRRAGISADEMAERAHESGFIDEPDPALLAERLRDDLGGGKVYSLSGDRFERKLEIEIDREFKAWAEMAEKEYQAVADEISAKARGILSEEDITISQAEGLRSARQVLAELDNDVKTANILQKCLAGDIQ